MFGEDSLFLLHIAPARLVQLRLKDMLPKLLAACEQVGAQLGLSTGVLVPLHMGPFAWASLQYGVWVPSADVPKDLGRSCRTSYNLASEVSDAIFL